MPAVIVPAESLYRMVFVPTNRSGSQHHRRTLQSGASHLCGGHAVVRAGKPLTENSPMRDRAMPSFSGPFVLYRLHKDPVYLLNSLPDFGSYTLRQKRFLKHEK